MLLLLDKGKPVPDTLFGYFAKLDEYRYELYSDLKKRKQLNRFPAASLNHLDLGKSALLKTELYNKPDSIIYIDRLQAEYKGKRGFIYFYKYKAKKDDLTWKLATVGLVPPEPTQFEFDDSTGFKISNLGSPLIPYYRLNYNRFDFTKLTDTRLKEDQPLTKQLNSELKKMLYSRRKSAKEFYGKDNNRSEYD